MTAARIVLLMSVSLAILSIMPRPRQVRAAILLTPNDSTGTGNDDTLVDDKLAADLPAGTQSEADGHDGNATDDGTATKDGGDLPDGNTTDGGTAINDGSVPRGGTTLDDGFATDDAGVTSDGTGTDDGITNDDGGMTDDDIDNDGVHVTFVDPSIDEESTDATSEDNFLDLGRMRIEELTLDDLMAFVCDGVESRDCVNVPPLR